MRRRLLIALGTIPLAMLIGVTALLVQVRRYQTVFGHVQGELVQIIRMTEAFESAVHIIRAELWRTQARQGDSLDRLVSSVEHAESIMARFGGFRDLRGSRKLLEALARHMEQFKTVTGRIATAHTPELRGQLAAQLIEIVTGMQSMSREVRAYVAAHADEEMQSCHRAMKLTVAAIVFTFMTPILIAVFIIRRVLEDVAEPVDDLVEGTERLAGGDLDYRVRTPLRNEFGVLAKSVNIMADRIADSEKQRLEAVQQTSVTLQHHINNSLATIMGLARRLRNVVLSRDENTIPADIEDEVKKANAVMQKLSELQHVVTTEYARGIRMIDTETVSSEASTEEPLDGATAETQEGGE